MAQTLIRGTQIQDYALLLKSDGSVPMTGALNMANFAINGLAAPVNATDAATKSYVDSLANGLTFKAPARVVSTANVALTGLQTIDGVTLVAGDRVLLVGQTDATQNGLFAAASGAWSRTADYASGSTQNEGMYVIVDEGTVGESTKYLCTTTNVGELITVDASTTTWVQDTSGNQITAGNGLTKTGNQIQALIGNGLGLDSKSGDIAVVADPAGLLAVSGAGVAIGGTSAAGQIIVSNSSGEPAWSGVTGDATLSGAGVIAVDNTSGSGFLKYGDLVSNETPAGTIDGTNTAFTLANANAYQLELYLNGVLLEPGAGNDYTLAGNAITMLFAPVTSDKLRANYVK